MRRRSDPYAPVFHVRERVGLTPGVEIRDLPNELFLHFVNLKRDMPAEILRIAAFLDIAIDEARWGSILEYCSFDWIRANASKTATACFAFVLGGRVHRFNESAGRVGILA